MQKILVISGHPNLKESEANRMILNKMVKAMPNADFLYLDETYPDYQIDVPREQARLVQYDTIILQFPLFWYSVPSLLKRYIDDLFFHGFAIGSKGDKLKGKKLMLSVTVGGPEAIYQHDGYTGRTMDEHLYPFEIMARSAQMVKLPNVYTHEIGYLAHSGKETPKVEALTDRHIEKIKAILEADL